MKVAILTSSRADFGIYSPLLKKIKEDPFFHMEIIAFGAHLSPDHGYTIREILSMGFEVKHKIETITNGDSPKHIAGTIGKTVSNFSDFWSKNRYDLVFAFGDRYEMFAAVVAASPFRLPFAHIHAGETTLGAIDNAYRHSISLMSDILFTSTEVYSKRAKEVVGDTKKIFNVGALSIEVMKNMTFLSKEEMLQNFNLDLTIPTILSTFHPETVEFEKNAFYIDELIKAWKILSEKYQIVITLPNADTTGLMIRQRILEFQKNTENIFVIESFGIEGYLSCMKYSAFLLGNTSSGFVEASFFPKYVINLGNRQKGRIITKNILNAKIEKNDILEKVKYIESAPGPAKIDIYGNGNTSAKIVKILKEIYE